MGGATISIGHLLYVSVGSLMIGTTTALALNVKRQSELLTIFQGKGLFVLGTFLGSALVMVLPLLFLD